MSVGPLFKVPDLTDVVPGAVAVDEGVERTVASYYDTPDLRLARVYYAALGRPSDEVEAALKAAAPHLRAVLGREVRLKYLPRLDFHRDPAIEQGQRVEDIIRSLHAEE